MKHPRILTVVFLIAVAAHVSARSTASKPRNACELLTKEEVAAIQGEAFSNAKLTTLGARSQCFYELPSFVQSVSVDLLRENAREYWRRNFSEDARENRELESEERENSEGPKEIEGIGREAFWAGNHRTGSLYVLSHDAVLRISVGGAGSEAEKIARAKKLAAKALRRM